MRAFVDHPKFTACRKGLRAWAQPFRGGALVALVGAFLSLGGASPTHASQEGGATWTVQSVSGIVMSRADENSDWVAVAPGDVLPDSAIVTTRATGRVSLFMGEDEITLSPDTEVELPARGNDAMTRVIENFGSIFVDVEKKAAQHFAVETPYLVAAVKGTSFRVDVSATAASVSVAEGTVGVTDKQTGKAADVHAGETGSVSGSSETGVSVGKQAASTAPDAAPASSLEEGWFAIFSQVGHAASSGGGGGGGGGKGPNGARSGSRGKSAALEANANAKKDIKEKTDKKDKKDKTTDPDTGPGNGDANGKGNGGGGSKKK